MADRVDDVMKACGSNAEHCRDICVKGCAAFDKFDKDGNGCLSRDEVRSLLQAGGSGMDPEHVFNFCDLDADGKITKEEFIKGLVCTSIEDDIRRVFNDFDQDHSGSIDKSELAAMSGECQKRGVDKGSLDRVLRKYDTDSSGNISFEEFKEAFFSK